VTGTLDSSVLMLNRVFQPLGITTVRHAFGLFAKGAAKAVLPDYRTCDWQQWADIPVQPTDDTVSTVSRYIRVPRVIAMTKYDRVPRKEMKFSRYGIYARDGSKCQFCGKKLPSSELSLDHVVPLSRGGLSTWENVVAACVRCNTRKADRTPAEAGMKLIATPKKPRANLVGRDLRVEWKSFLDQAYWLVELT
jgi:5-methylcytosine-specific restriction endonuclease McrA